MEADLLPTGNLQVACFQIEAGRIETRRLERLRRSYPNLIVQIVDARVGTNERFFKMIAAQTFSAMKQGSLLARKPEVDLLLRLASTTQISEALSKVGYRSKARRVLVAAGRRVEVERFVTSGKVEGTRLASSDLTFDEYRRVEEAAILSSLRS